MLELSIEVESAPQDLEARLSRVAQVCFEIEGIEKAEVYGRVVDDEAIRIINRDTRGIDRATDVLSFPTVTYPSGTAKDNAKLIKREYNIATGRSSLGDFVLSLPRARVQAAEYGHSLERELSYLTAHAMFHLMGYDHETDRDKRAMRAMEETAMARLGAKRDENDD